jgi:hypothetical protein
MARNGSRRRFIIGASCGLGTLYASAQRFALANDDDSTVIRFQWKIPDDDIRIIATDDVPLASCRNALILLQRVGESSDEKCAQTFTALFDTYAWSCNDLEITATFYDRNAIVLERWVIPRVRLNCNRSTPMRVARTMWADPLVFKKVASATWEHNGGSWSECREDI